MSGGRGQPWLVAIDLQQVFADPASPWATPRFAEILPRVEALVEEYAGRVVFTRFVPPSEPVGSWVDYYAAWPFALDPATSYELVLEPGDAPVVSLPTMGKWGPELLAATGGSTYLVLCGVSLGGNQLVKFLGEGGAGQGPPVPDTVRAAAAISVPFDLARGSRRIGQGFSRVYERHFLRSLSAKARRKLLVYPDLFDEGRLGGLRTLWALDDLVTAPVHGFRDAADYYDRSSARRFLAGVRVPTLLHQRGAPDRLGTVPAGVASVIPEFDGWTSHGWGIEVKSARQALDLAYLFGL